VTEEHLAHAFPGIVPEFPDQLLTRFVEEIP